MRFPIFARIAVISAIVLALLIPLALIKGKVVERQERAVGVQQGFAQETAGPQVVAGPFLALTCEETYVEERVVHRDNGRPLTVREKKQRPCATALIPPRSLNVRGTLPVEQRYRGIYPIRLYRADMTLSGDFDWPAPPAPSGDEVRGWKDAYLVLAISDVRGIRNIPVATTGTQQREFAPGPFHPAVRSGLHASLGDYSSFPDAASLPFRLSLELIGTTKLDIAPVGAVNTIRLASEWPHPSFAGAFLPDQREVSSAGFAASWKVNHFATGGNAFWSNLAAEGKLFSSPRLLGVALVEPVNAYSLAYRATEYGFLFVLLTFSAFALLELIWGVALHPAQYLLVGLALAVFFLVLIALSEHIHFAWAYLAASGACITLLTYYLRYPLASLARTVLFAGLFTVLYGSLYVLLKSEDHALLLGSLLVFAALAAAMALTRKLDWAAVSKRLSPGTPA